MHLNLLGNMSSSQVIISFFMFTLSIDFCYAGLHRYRKSLEDGHRLRHPTRAYSHDCFFTPVNCLRFVNIDSEVDAPSMSNGEANAVEYSISNDNELKEHSNEQRRARSIRHARHQRHLTSSENDYRD